MMASSRRDRTVGAGYNYQWEVATFILLRFVLRRGAANQSAVEATLAWVRPIEKVLLEGSDQDGNRLEDLGLVGADGRELHIQVKESDEDATQSQWRPTSPKFVEFMERVARQPNDSTRHFLFLTNGTIHKTLRDLFNSETNLRAFHTKLQREVSKRKKKQSKAAPLPDIDHCIMNWKRTSAAGFIGPTPVDENLASEGVGLALMNLLDTIGVADPGAAYMRLVREVERWSYRKGGTTLTLEELRSEFMRLLNLGAAASGSRLISLHEYLQRWPRDEPNWQQLEAGELWLSDPAIQMALDALNAHQLALLCGGSGCGKTVLSRAVAFRLSQEGRCPVYWDFEHLGKLPYSVADAWSHANATARIQNLRPFLVLENVHLSRDEFATTLGQLALQPAGADMMFVLATSRARMSVGPAMQERLDAVTIDLSGSLVERGSAIVDWWLERLPLTQEERIHAYRSIPWSSFFYDLVVLRLVLETFDRTTMSVSTERAEDRLEARLRRTISALLGADEFLYLVCALGRSGLAADLTALAQLLRISPESVQQIAERATADGLISVDAERRLCRFWHDSLAQRYWEIFQTRHLDWAANVRTRFRSAP